LWYSPNGLAIKTLVNGELRQGAGTDDLLYDITKILCHLTRGATSRKEIEILLGTPGGVAAFMEAPQWPLDNDIVEIDIEEIRRTNNKMVFET
jgi:2-keto-4-pentenoate hydratase/2-oxohepta-3-ene-1,7-dioic acid hydratase in catechol pathway